METLSDAVDRKEAQQPPSLAALVLAAKSRFESGVDEAGFGFLTMERSITATVEPFFLGDSHALAQSAASQTGLSEESKTEIIRKCADSRGAFLRPESAVSWIIEWELEARYPKLLAEEERRSKEVNPDVLWFPREVRNDMQLRIERDRMALGLPPFFSQRREKKRSSLS